MGGVQARMESALARLLPAAHIAPARLHEAMRYATLEGGKRVRPLLAFAAGEVRARRSERLEVAAAAVEMIHAYSLVHDDLPCMDDDVLRRGKPTVHVEYDEATALLVGDALQSLAFQLLAEHRLADDARAAARDGEDAGASAAGSRGMAGGQQIDLEATGKTLTPARARVHAHPQDRRADPGGGDARALPAAMRSTKRRGKAGQVRQGHRPGLPGGRRRARLRRQHRDARQDRGQGLEAGQADLRLGDGPAAGAASWPRSCAPRRTPRSRASAARARRLGELADFIVLRKF